MTKRERLQVITAILEEREACACIVEAFMPSVITPAEIGEYALYAIRKVLIGEVLAVIRARPFPEPEPQ